MIWLSVKKSNFGYQSQQILSVLSLEHILHAFADLGGSHPAVFVGDLLQTGDLKSLTRFDRSDEVRGVKHAVVRTGVEPGIAALEDLDVELTSPEIFVVDGGDFELAASGRFDVFRNIHDVVVVEIEAGHGIVRFRPGGLLLDRDRLALGIELDHAEAFRIADMIPEHRRADLTVSRIAQELSELGSVEDVVAEHECHAVAPDEILAYQERLCEPFGVRLDGVGEIHAET